MLSDEAFSWYLDGIPPSNRTLYPKTAKGAIWPIEELNRKKSAKSAKTTASEHIFCIFLVFADLGASAHQIES
jgi:hypothetical protein